MKILTALDSYFRTLEPSQSREKEAAIDALGRIGMCKSFSLTLSFFLKSIDTSDGFNSVETHCAAKLGAELLLQAFSSVTKRVVEAAFTKKGGNEQLVMVHAHFRNWILVLIYKDAFPFIISRFKWLSLCRVTVSIFSHVPFLSPPFRGKLNTLHRLSLFFANSQVGIHALASIVGAERTDGPLLSNLAEASLKDLIFSELESLSKPSLSVSQHLSMMKILAKALFDFGFCFE